VIPRFDLFVHLKNVLTKKVTYCEHHFEAPKMRFKPVPLTNVPQRVNECVDVQAVVDRVGEITQVTSRKDQKQLDKRDVYLVDKTATEIRLTLWGDEAMKFSIKPGTVLGVKGAFVKEFNGWFCFE
jgi:replication factor A1